MACSVDSHRASGLPEQVPYLFCYSSTECHAAQVLPSSKILLERLGGCVPIQSRSGQLCRQSAQWYESSAFCSFAKHQWSLDAIETWSTAYVFSRHRNIVVLE